MNTFKATALQLIADLEASTSFVYGGEAGDISVMVYQRPHELIFSHNLGGSFVPTKKEATQLLDQLQQHYEALKAASPAFVKYVEGKAFKTEIIVFSGQMDFPVATREGGEIIWHTNLKDT